MIDMKLILISCAILALCDSYAVVPNPKCSISDSACLSKYYAAVLQDIADNGNAALGIPAADPYIIKNLDMNLLGMIKLTLVDGKAVGFKNCHSNSFRLDLETMHAHVDYTCDIFHAEAHHKISTLPAWEMMFKGVHVHGEGEIKMDLEKVNLVFDKAFQIVKLDDGEYHIQLIPEESTNTVVDAEKASFDITNIYVGSQDIGPVLTNILNENWKALGKLFGQVLIDNIMGLFYEEAAKFFKGVPAKDIFSDDLSKYVKS